MPTLNGVLFDWGSERGGDSFGSGWDKVGDIKPIRRFVKSNHDREMQAQGIDGHVEYEKLDGHTYWTYGGIRDISEFLTPTYRPILGGRLQNEKLAYVALNTPTTCSSTTAGH